MEWFYHLDTRIGRSRACIHRFLGKISPIVRSCKITKMKILFFLVFLHSGRIREILTLVVTICQKGECSTFWTKLQLIIQHLDGLLMKIQII